MSAPAHENDLRHIASHPTLVAPAPASPHARPAQPLGSLSPNSRPGSRSPTSIPSSPTSIRSSSSAIFERDIEPNPSTHPHTHSHPHPNPHRTPRSRATEQLDQSVPNVLAEAASALADSAEVGISVIAPLSFVQGGSRSPPVRSRSPSPVRPSMAPRRMSTGPLPPGGFTSTPTTATSLSQSPVPSPTSTHAPLPDTLHSPSAQPRHTSSLHGSPSPSKRLSFIAYSDLLSSTPLTSLPLAALTSPHSSAPPPHLPAVTAAAAPSPLPSSAHSQGAPSRPLSTYSVGTSGGMSVGRGGGAEEQLGIGQRLQDDIGGEWEREGFGKGLEERLEEVMVAKA